MFQHIVEFLNIVNSDQEAPVGLGYFSEQAFVSVHSDIQELWQREKVATTHSDFGEKLRSFIVRYNAKHI